MRMAMAVVVGVMRMMLLFMAMMSLPALKFLGSSNVVFFLLHFLSSSTSFCACHFQRRSKKKKEKKEKEKKRLREGIDKTQSKSTAYKYLT